MRKQILFGGLTTVLLLGSAAFAETINYNGMTVDVNASGEVKTMNVGDVKVEVTPTGVNMQSSQGKANMTVSADGKSANITSTNGGKTSSINVVLDGKTINMNSETSSLKVQVESGLSANGQAQVLELKGNSDLMIQTEDDLNAYNSLVVKARPSVKSVTVGNAEVSVIYRQPAKFLGVFSTHINAKAKVENGGNVNIVLPWYAFLFTKDSSAVESKIEANLKSGDGVAKLDVNSLGRGSVEMQSSSDGKATLQLRNNAHAVNMISTAIDASVTAE